MLAHPAASDSANISPHMPKRQRGLRHMRLPHRRAPIALHDLQKREWCRPTTLRARQMPGRPHNHTRALRPTSNSPSQGSHGPPNLEYIQKEHAWMSLSTYVAARTVLTQPLSRFSPPMPVSYLPPAVAQASWPNAKRREKFDKYRPYQPCPIHPRDHWTTWLPRPKTHQTPPQRHGPPTDSYPGRLGGHPDHLAKQHLQTTTSSRPRNHHA